jgi:2-iminobutanoate/2-iminopropanoate deaminase
MKRQIKTNDAPQAIGPYNQGIISGKFLFLSGQIPLKSDGSPVGESIEEQTRQCLSNIENILKEAGVDKNSIVKTTLFITDMDEFAKINEVYADFFKGSVFPARSTVEVSRLPKNVKIEIEAIAEL